MEGRPVIAAILAVLCGIAGLLGVAYFLSAQRWPFVAASAGGIAIAFGLWNQWRWAWWVGFALLSGLLVWNWQHPTLASNHLWFVSAALWVYFLVVFKDYN